VKSIEMSLGAARLRQVTAMKRIILGTAGHIDHGKTALVKALTGVDCDRLKEEKLRGITIELGFALLRLPDGQTAGIIDVPGHERFVRNMVAGAGGIDAVMLIVAADEGVMPQTREHLEICRLLGIGSGVVVLTKSDLVESTWIDLVSDDVQKLTQGTFLEGAPIIPVSSATGAGIDSLRSALARLIAAIAERPAAGLVRLPIDRVFVMKGFGTVVTGTLLAGQISVGDEVEILPHKIRAKIRGIQVHNARVETATAGLRTALNVQGLDKAAVSRGDVVAAPGTLVPTKRITARFEYVPSASRPLKNRSLVRFHTGTAEIQGWVRLMGSDELKPGASGFIQLDLEAPAVVLPHDRYVLRGLSPVETLGGGAVLDNLPTRLRRSAPDRLEQAAALSAGSQQDRIVLYCREAGVRGLDIAGLRARSGLAEEHLQAVLDTMLAAGNLVAFSTAPLQVTLPETVRDLGADILAQLRTYHERHPLKPGPAKEELRAGLARGTDAKLFAFVIARLVAQGSLRVRKEFLALPEHRPVLPEAQQGLRHDILSLYARAAEAPPTKKEVLAQLKVAGPELEKLLALLVREGALVKVSEDLLYEVSTLQGLMQQARTLMERNGELTIQGFKDLTGLTRKFIIPLFEHWDKSRFTLRVGDKRVLRKASG